MADLPRCTGPPFLGMNPNCLYQGLNPGRRGARQSQREKEIVKRGKGGFHLPVQ